MPKERHEKRRITLEYNIQVNTPHVVRPSGDKSEDRNGLKQLIREIAQEMADEIDWVNRL